MSHRAPPPAGRRDEELRRRRHRVPRPIAAMLALLFALAFSRRALGEHELARGVVIKIELQEIYVSLGVKQGLADGQPLRLKRPIRLRHPITRAPVDDWIPLGSATITQAGSAMSRAVLGPLASAVKVGDLVEVLVERPDPGPSPRSPASPASPSSPSSPATPAPPPADPATLEVLDAFTAQLGQPVEARIAAWEHFLSVRAGSPYAGDLRRELAALRQLRDELSTTSTADRVVLSAARHAARSETAAEIAMPLVFVLEHPEEVASAYLHYRVRGARTFRSLLLTREHEIYLRGTLPAEAVKPPGVDYFVEVSAPSGRSGLALGSPEAPVQVAVPPPPLVETLAAAPRRSSVRIAVDYLDFHTFDRRPGDYTDHMTAATIDFTYRLDSPVHLLGVGYGALSGRGGYADTMWTPLFPPHRSGFQYGYADLEVASAQLPLALGAKLIAGVGRDGFGLGVEGRIRIGDIDQANLLFSASTIAQVGFLSEVRFGVPLSKPLRLGVSVAATDQPAGGDIGVKLGSEVEWLGLGRLSLLLRGSWQGRAIDHGGLGGGAGIGAYW